MKVCASEVGAQGAADANDKGEEPQAGRAWLVGRHGILAWCEGLLEEAVRRTPRGGRVLVRDVGISGGLTRLDLQDRVAVAPVEALQDDVRLVSKPREALHEGSHPASAIGGLADDHPLTKHSRQQPGQGVAHGVVHRPL